MRLAVWAMIVVFTLATARVAVAEENPVRHWLWSTAYAIPKELTSEGSGYFSIVEGKNGKLYIGTAKYRHNCYLVEFDPKTKEMRVVVDAHKEIGTTATGFAAQAKFHTRNNVGESGRIYVATKQGYPNPDEKRTEYLGGYPLVYDPATGKTRVYEIPIKHQGIISITPDESRGVAYISTCSDERPIESTHFMSLDLETGQYRDLLDCRHMYAFIVVDHLGRAYHPIQGGDIARFDPRTNKLDRLKQTIDGQPPTKESLLALPETHPINWDFTPDRKAMYAVAMSGNQLYRYDLTTDGGTLAGVSCGKLIESAQATDCRAMCVAPDGTVWAGVAVTFAGRGQFLHAVSYRPGDKAPRDHGPIAISNPKYTPFVDAAGKALPFHHGVYPLADGTLLPRYTVMGFCAHSSGKVYALTLYPFTLHEIQPPPKLAGLTTEYRHNSHADMLMSRLLQSDTLDGKGEFARLKLASIHTDQVPNIDISRKLSQEHKVPIAASITDAVTLGGKDVAVDGVLLVAEHGFYPANDLGQTLFPKRRMFEELFATFRRTGRAVPVFCDKHLSDNWTDAKWIYDTAHELKVPLMAGSSVPGTWRYPPVDVPRGAKLKHIFACSHHTLDAYGFHAMEIVQALAERRAGGETGIRRIRCLPREQMWKALTDGTCDRAAYEAAVAVLKDRRWEKNGKTIEEFTTSGHLVIVDYTDGLRASILTANGPFGEWSAGWTDADGKTQAALFDTQEWRPFYHFAVQLMGIERHMHTHRAPWPVERTLLSSGVIHVAHRSLHEGGRAIDTPFLDIRYTSDWNWHQPPERPTDRPITSQ